MNKTITKVVTVDQYGYNGPSYYNFFFTPGSIESLEFYLRDGWTVKHIEKLGDKKATVVFEKNVDVSE